MKSDRCGFQHSIQETKHFLATPTKTRRPGGATSRRTLSGRQAAPGAAQAPRDSLQRRPSLPEGSHVVEVPLQEHAPCHDWD